MFSLVKFDIFSLGPSFTAIGINGWGKSNQSDPNAAAELIVPWQDLSPDAGVASLLSWQSQRNESFSGRDVELARLEEWAQSEPAVNIQFMVAEGGTGKSRLGAQFADNMKSKGWAAGFVSLRFGRQYQMKAKGTLLVIDYPEEHETQIRELFKDLASLGTDHKIRVLLLTRRPLSNWYEIIEGTGAANLVQPRALNLERLNSQSALEIFNSTFTRAYNSLHPEIISRTNWQLTRENVVKEFTQKNVFHQRALFIMAAAITRAIDPRAPELRYTGPDAVKALAEREVERLRRIADSKTLKPYSLARAKAITALTGELTFEQLQQLEQDTGIPLGFPDADARDNLRHTGLLDSSGIVPILQPDILAAAFLVDVLSRRKEYAAELLWAALAQNIEFGLNRFGRLCQDSENVLGLKSFKLREVLANAVREKFDRALLLKPHLPRHYMSVALVDLSLAMSITLLNHTTDVDSQSLLLGNLTTVLSQMGEHEQVVKISPELIGRFQQLAKQHPNRFERSLAIAFNNLGGSLLELGRFDDALIATQKAVDIRNEFSKQEQHNLLPDIAMSYHNMGEILCRLGRNEEAKNAATEAVRIYRDLEAQSPGNFLPDLAGTLENMGIRFRKLNMFNEALENTLEAVDILKGLCESRPEIYLTLLGGALSNLAECFSNLNKFDMAIQVAEESVEIYKRYVEQRPRVYLPKLANALDNVGNTYSETGSIEKALSATSEALEIRKKLAEKQPFAFLPELAGSFINYSGRKYKLGCWDEALEAITEAESIFRKLAAQQPDIYSPELAMVLHNKGEIHGATGNHVDAQAATSDSVDILRDLSETQPDVFLPELAIGLNSLGARHYALGDWEKARAATFEAVAILKKLAEQQSDTYRPDLANSLNNLGKDLFAMGRLEDALSAATETVDIYRPFAKQQPSAFQPHLMVFLNNLGQFLAALGRWEEAACTAQEAVEICTVLADQQPEKFLLILAMYRRNLGVYFSELGKYEEAIETDLKTVDVLKARSEKLSEPGNRGDVVRDVKLT